MTHFHQMLPKALTGINVVEYHSIGIRIAFAAVDKDDREWIIGLVVTRQARQGR